jgi:hypothetical protein
MALPSCGTVAGRFANSAKLSLHACGVPIYNIHRSFAHTSLRSLTRAQDAQEDYGTRFILVSKLENQFDRFL